VGNLRELTDTESKRLPIIEHLVELRKRLGICLLAVGLTSGLGFGVAGRLIEWLKRPAGSLLPRLAFFSPTEALVAYAKVAVAFGVVLALPVILYQLWAFVRPGLTWRERSMGLAFVWWGSALFALGAALAYAVCLPFFLRFLLTVGGPSLEPVISISRYLSFVMGVILIFGALCELPLIVWLLSRLGILTPHTLRRHRRLAMLAMLIVAAVASPTTDAISLLLMALPLWLLYELSIIVSRVSGRPAR
jgi:sec-independent protein translocase protein TatC